MPTLAEAVNPPQQSSPRPSPPAMASDPRSAVTASSFAAVQKILIEYEALFRRDLTIDFYVTYPMRPATHLSPPPLRQSELDASAASRPPMCKPPPAVTPSPLTCKTRGKRVSKKAKAAAKTRVASACEWRSFRLVFPGALWPFVLRYHRQLLTRAVRRDAEAALPPGETVKVCSLYAAEAEIEVILAVRESPGSQSRIPAVLSISSFVEAWEVYKAVGVFLSRGVPPAPPPLAMSPPPSYESAACASTATTGAAMGKAATTLQASIIPPLIPPPAPHQFEVNTTSVPAALLSNDGGTAAALTMQRPLNMKVPLLFPAEGTDELKRLIDTVPSPLRRALRRDAMYAVPDAEVQVHSWAVHPAGLYVELFLRCADGSDAHVAFSAETAMGRCPFTETWDVIRAHTAGLASVTVTMPVVVKRSASVTPAPQPTDRNLTTTTPPVGATTTATAPTSDSLARSASLCVERGQRSWFLSANAVLNASESANSEQHCGSATNTVHSLIAGKAANSSVKPSPMRPNAGAVSASTVAATSHRAPAVVSSRECVANTATTQTSPTVVPTRASARRIELTKISVLTQTDSVQSLLSAASSTPSVSDIGVPCASSVSAQTLLHPPLLRSAKESAALMMNLLDGPAQGFIKSAENSPKQLALRAVTVEGTPVHLLGDEANSTNSMSETKAAHRTLSSLLPFRPLRPIPSHWCDHAATVESERHAPQLLLDAQLQSGHNLRSNMARRTLARVSSAVSVGTVRSWKDNTKGFSPVKRARVSAVMQVERKVGESDSLGDGAKRKRSSVTTKKETMSSLQLSLVALPVSEDFQERVAVVGEERLTSCMPRDAGGQRSKSWREHSIVRSILDREGGAAASEPHEPIVLSSCATGVKQTQKSPSGIKSTAPLMHVPPERLSTDEQQRGSLEANACGIFVASSATKTERREALSPAEGPAIAAESVVQEAESEKTEGTFVSSETRKKWRAEPALCPQLKDPSSEADVQNFFGLLTAAIEKVIVGCGEKLRSELMTAPDAPLQPLSHEPQAEAIPAPSTTSVFSSVIIEAPRSMPQRCSITTPSAPATPQHHALPSKSVLAASSKAVNSRQLELFSSRSASAASTPAKCADTPRAQSSASSRSRWLLADDRKELAKAVRANDASLLTSAMSEMQTMSVANDNSLPVDFSSPKAALPCGRNPPGSQRPLERLRLLSGRHLHETAAAHAPLRVHFRRFFSAPGLTKERLAGQWEEARSLFLVETCAVLNAPPEFVEELQLSGNLTVDATVRMPSSDIEKKWRLLLIEYDYPQLNELLRGLAAGKTLQTLHQVEVKREPEAASHKNLFYSTTSVSAPGDGDATPLDIYVKGDFWPQVIDIHADVLREALISDATESLCLSEIRVERVCMLSCAAGARFTFFLRNCGANSLRAVQDVLQRCPFTAAWELYHRFRGASCHSINHQVTDTTCTLQLGGKAWGQVLNEHGGLLAETFVWEVLQCLRGSDDAAVTVSVSVTDVAAKPDGLTIGYDITSAADGADVDRRRVADVVKEYPFPQLWKVYDTFMLARDPFKYTKNAHWIASRRLRNLSTAYNFAEELMERRYSHIGFALEMPLSPVEAHKAVVALPDEAGNAALVSVGTTAEMMEAQKEYELKYLPAPVAVLEPSGSVVPPEAAAVSSAGASLVEVAEATTSTKADTRTACSPPRLPSLQKSSLQERRPSEMEEQQQQRRQRRRSRHNHSNERSEQSRHSRQRRSREKAANTREQRALRYDATASSAETECDGESEAAERTLSAERNGFEDALAPPPAPLRCTPVARPVVRVLTSPVSAKASAIASAPNSRSSLTAFLRSAAPGEHRASSPVQLLDPFYRTPQSAAAPPFPWPSHPGSSTSIDRAEVLPMLHTEARGKRYLAPQAAQCHFAMSRSPLANTCLSAPIALLDVRMAHPSAEAAPDTQMAASATPTAMHPPYCAHHYLGTPTLPYEFPQRCQAEKVAAYPFSAPGLYCGGPASSSRSCSPPMLTPASSFSGYGSAASVTSGMASTFSASPLQDTMMRPCHPSSFVVLSTEPSGVLQKLRNDVDSVEETIRARYPRMQREFMMATATASLPNL
ncbi:hypothetical protein CUR178_02092 [Leishmania enriettii]|uniref:Flagellar attachment zone protein 1 conserved domain-containing protein n=1 Tax=Leishmania enriettii TaxID=5663 RepID=A0A836GQH3_LEIEN|nr:hypothetical protein CUR178_02092 [Leishmania enriettii]